MSETQLFFILWTDTWNQILNSRYYSTKSYRMMDNFPICLPVSVSST